MGSYLRFKNVTRRFGSFTVVTEMTPDIEKAKLLPPRIIEVTSRLACAVNGLYTYWMSKQPIPGGTAFENFELREPFKSGASVIFEITREPPESPIKP